MNNKQYYFNLYKNADFIEGKTTMQKAGVKSGIAKKYLKQFGTVIKNDILTQYEPYQDIKASTEVVDIAKTVKAVQISPKEVIKKLEKVVKEKTSVKKESKVNSPRITNELVREIASIKKFVVEIVEQAKIENEIRAKNAERISRESASTMERQSKQIEFCLQQTKKVTQELENSKIENKILLEKLKQFEKSSV